MLLEVWLVVAPDGAVSAHLEHGRAYTYAANRHGVAYHLMKEVDPPAHFEHPQGEVLPTEFNERTPI